MGHELGQESRTFYLEPPARQLQVNASIYVNPSIYTSIPAVNAVSSRMNCPIVVKSIGF